MPRKITLNRLVSLFTETFGLGRVAALGAILLICVATLMAAYLFVKSAPPTSLTITSGPEGSLFATNAERYRVILARNGVALRVLSSHGSLENLERLLDPTLHVDVGFVQGGVTNGTSLEKLVSLGSIAYQPLLVFYRGTTTVETLSALSGKKLAIGPVGSGTHALALALLSANGIEPGGPAELLNLDATEASNALSEGKIDAVFLMGDSASVLVMRKLLRTPEVQLLSFAQADGYVRRVRYLNKLDLPRGSIDLGKNIPVQDVHLIGPTVELVARENLHPALSDLLLETAKEVHGNASLLQKRGEFPAPMEHDFRISSEATRYYKTGKSFLYRHLPFWLASLVNRLLAVVVPLVVVLIPGLRTIPALFRWRTRLRLYRWYRALLLVEKDMYVQKDGNREELLARLDDIERAANKTKVPASFADQFYALRGHISFVRQRLRTATER